MRKVYQTLGEVLSSIAENKRKAVAARFRATEPGQEKPREVYLKACQEIASGFLTEGFQYYKTGPRLSRRSGNFLQTISFQSSHYNVAGQHVALWVSAGVSSLVLKRWRSQQVKAVRTTEHIAGGMIGTLAGETASLEWDLADKHERDETIRDIVKTIRDIVLPFFDQFDDIPQLAERLCQETCSWIPLGDAVEFLLCFHNRATAEQVASVVSPTLLYIYRSP